MLFLGSSQRIHHFKSKSSIVAKEFVFDLEFIDR